MHQNYPEPASALLSYGPPPKLANPTNPHRWPDYVKEFELSLEDVPHLSRMLEDPAINDADSNDPCIWAPIHAWRALGQLGAIEAIPNLLRCLDYDDEDEVSDWNMEEIPEVFGKIGAPAIDPLSHYLNDFTKGTWSLVAAAEGLAHIATTTPESRPDCVKAITQRLERYVENAPDLNGFLICDLINLKAVASLDVIRNAFHAGAVEISIGGDLEDVEIELGVRTTRSTPRPHYHSCGTLCHADHHEQEEWGKTLPQPQRTAKIGRNDPCLCGSGKKYKKCCLA